MMTGAGNLERTHPFEVITDHQRFRVGTGRIIVDCGKNDCRISQGKCDSVTKMADSEIKKYYV